MGSCYRLRFGCLRSGFNGGVFFALGEKLAHITVAISSMCFKVDLCNDGHCKITAILVETAGITKQAQRVLSHLAPRAPPFHDQEQSVRNRRKQPRFDSTEHRRTVNNHTFVTLAQLTEEGQYLFRRAFKVQSSGG